MESLVIFSRQKEEKIRRNAVSLRQTQKDIVCVCMRETRMKASDTRLLLSQWTSSQNQFCSTHAGPSALHTLAYAEASRSFGIPGIPMHVNLHINVAYIEDCTNPGAVSTPANRTARSARVITDVALLNVAAIAAFSESIIDLP